MAANTAFLPRPPGPAFGRSYQQVGNYSGNLHPGGVTNPYVRGVSGGRVLDAMNGMGQNVIPTPDPRSQYASQVGTVQEFFNTALPDFVRKYIVIAGLEREYPHFNILPPKEATEKQIPGYAYAVVKFDQQLPTKTPEGTAPRIIKHSMEQHEFRHEREGQAFRMSQDDLMTDHGKELFSNYVHTLASNSTVSAQITITATILRCHLIEQMNRSEFGHKDSMGDTGAGRVMTTLGYLSVTERGIYKLFDYVRNTSQKSDMPAVTDMLCTNTVFGLLVFGDDKETEFYRKGPKASRIEEEGGQYYARRGLAGVRFVEEPSYVFGGMGAEGNLEQNMLFKMIECGRVYFCTKEHMFKPNYSFKQTAHLGWLNYNDGDGVVQTQNYLDLLYSAACWDHNTGELWSEYDALNRDNGAMWKTVAEEAMLQAPNGQTITHVDPFVTWLPGKPPRKCVTISDINTKYFTTNDQSTNVRRAASVFKSSITSEAYDSLCTLIEHADEWFTPEYRYAEAFAFMIAAAGGTLPNGSNLIAGEPLKVNSKNVYKHYTALDISSAFDDKLALQTADPKISVWGRLFEAFPTYFLREETDLDDQAPTMRIIARGDYFPGFSTLRAVKNLLHSGTQLLSQELRTTLTKGMNQLTTLMTWLQKSFSCVNAPNFHFDPRVTQWHQTKPPHPEAVVEQAARSMLFGPRYQTVFVTDMTRYEGDKNNGDYQRHGAGAAGWTQAKNLHTGGSLSVQDAADITKNPGIMEILYKTGVSVQVNSKQYTLDDSFAISATMLKRVPMFSKAYARIYEKMKANKQFLATTAGAAFTAVGKMILDVFRDIATQQTLDPEQLANTSLLLHSLVKLAGEYPDFAKFKAAVGSKELQQAAQTYYADLKKDTKSQIRQILDQLQQKKDFTAIDPSSNVKSNPRGFRELGLSFSKRYFQQFQEAFEYVRFTAAERATDAYQWYQAHAEVLSSLRPTVNLHGNVKETEIIGYTQTRARVLHERRAPLGFLNHMPEDSSTGSISEVYKDFVANSGFVNPQDLRSHNSSGTRIDPRDTAMTSGVPVNQPSRFRYSRVFGELTDETMDSYSQQSIDYLQNNSSDLARLGGEYRERIGLEDHNPQCTVQLDAGICPDFSSPAHIERTNLFPRTVGAADNILLYCINQAYCGTRIHRDAFAAMYDQDIPPPIGFAIVDPYIKCRMSAVVCMALAKTAASAGAGFLSYLLPDFSAAYDAEQKMWTFTLTFSMAGVITEPRRFLIFPEAVFEGYFGGGDGKIIKTGYMDAFASLDVTSYLNMKHQAVDYNYRTKQRSGNRFVFHLGYSTPENELPQHINLAGSLLDQNYTLTQWIPSGLTTSNVQGAPIPYASALLVLHRFGFHKTDMRKYASKNGEAVSYAATLSSLEEGNTIVSRAAQWVFSPKTQEFTFKKYTAKGALEKVSMEGATAVLRGELTAYQVNKRLQEVGV